MMHRWRRWIDIYSTSHLIQRSNMSSDQRRLSLYYLEREPRAQLEQFVRAIHALNIRGDLERHIPVVQLKSGAVGDIEQRPVQVRASVRV